MTDPSVETTTDTTVHPVLRWGSLPLPLRTRDLPGTGGALRVEPEDFEVEEIPAYEPCGEGEHLYLWIEKRGRATDEVKRLLARQLDLRPDDVGTAGLKDKHAVTRQWFSVAVADEQGLDRASMEGVRVLRTSRHTNKLKTGHLRGNRFRIRVREATEDGGARARAALEVIGKLGVPNYFGEQRFGRGGETIRIGLSLLGVGIEGPPVTKRIGKGLRRLALSSVQSVLFNQVVAARTSDGSVDRVHVGEVLQKRDSGGLFLAEDIAREQERFDTGETVPTGPMFGPKMKWPEGPVAELETRLLTDAALDPESFRSMGKLMLGTRRPLLVWPEDWELEEAPGGYTVGFSLPSGAYASVVMRELLEP